MICRKQGRRSAQTAEETKHLILAAAGQMFCEHGFEKVSLRNISDVAGVSHSLIRHHFGSKEQIWYTVSDTLSTYMQTYIEALINEFPKGKPAKIVLYNFTMKLLAHMLLNPQPIQFIADAIRQEGEFFDYFIDSSGRFETITQGIVDQYNQEHPENPIILWEIKWQLTSAAHAAVSLNPMLNLVWDDSPSKAEALLRHWRLIDKNIARDFNIDQKDRLVPEQLADLLLPIACDFSNNEELNEKLRNLT